jgi:hypothetical protein
MVDSPVEAIVLEMMDKEMGTVDNCQRTLRGRDFKRMMRIFSVLGFEELRGFREPFMLRLYHTHARQQSPKTASRTRYGARNHRWMPRNAPTLLGNCLGP